MSLEATQVINCSKPIWLNRLLSHSYCSQKAYHFRDFFLPSCWELTISFFQDHFLPSQRTDIILSLAESSRPPWTGGNDVMSFTRCRTLSRKWRHEFHAASHPEPEMTSWVSRGVAPWTSPRKLSRKISCRGEEYSPYSLTEIFVGSVHISKKLLLVETIYLKFLQYLHMIYKVEEILKFVPSLCPPCFPRSFSVTFHMFLNIINRTSLCVPNGKHFKKSKYQWETFNFKITQGKPCTALIKKKIKISSYVRKSRRERLQSHIWLTASSYI